MRERRKQGQRGADDDATKPGDRHHDSMAKQIALGVVAMTEAMKRIGKAEADTPRADGK